jgi:putative Ca2+/H+ antiporter (TMEM165/GDT1 family)
MDLKTVGATFLFVFLAELGDKTQLATFGLASGEKSRLAVFVGASLALIATSAIAVLLGSVAARYLPERWVRLGAGLLFVVLGGLLLWQSAKG